MKRKEVDDVMGGEGAWDNVDQTEGIHPLVSNPHIYGIRADGRYCYSAMSERRLWWNEGVLLYGADPKRGRDDDSVFQGMHILRAGFCT